MHRIMDMDSEIINQNMDADGMQSIHINGDEAELLVLGVVGIIRNKAKSGGTVAAIAP